MIFWVFAIILTTAAVLSVIVPLVSKSHRASSALDHDREIYRARIAEIDADVALRRMPPGEAEATKAEEGRKLLAASKSGDRRGFDTAPSGFRLITVFVLLAVPAFAVFVYLGSGRPGMVDMAIATRPDKDTANQSITQLLERAEARLAAQPDDLRGWAVIAPVYMRLGRVPDAIIAYRNALRLDSANKQFKVSLAEALIVDAGGVVTEDARKLLSEVVAASPENAQARFYLAIAAGQEGKLDIAAKAWEQLIADAPPEAPWLPAARTQYASVQEKRGVTTRPEIAGSEDRAGQPGPTREDIEAAAQMSAADRQEMIRAMVAGLADKLRENPSDMEGWRRLIRSYAVLGENGKAREAIAAARVNLASNEDFMRELNDIESTLGTSQGGGQ